ncbi:hypothetical protein BD779DRAFT_1498333, partial [Infundibulicybe gibba]
MIIGPYAPHYPNDEYPLGGNQCDIHLPTRGTFADWKDNTCLMGFTTTYRSRLAVEARKCPRATKADGRTAAYREGFSFEGGDITGGVQGPREPINTSIMSPGVKKRRGVARSMEP